MQWEITIIGAPAIESSLAKPTGSDNEIAAPYRSRIIAWCWYLSMAAFSSVMRESASTTCNHTDFHWRVPCFSSWRFPGLHWIKWMVE